ncbi:Ig domain protein, group 2 domain protein [Psychromonas ingrahamii 37]|uniref:Ig domain protein, group 2 domain protein n=1 Tax=Psychromonas ingrahamii (strain DSM 17664 / CCUG 51855 / 37) TaxID=357804 RepID=A1SUT2_PSYIN|nr:Ig domain-containing protein [Psychromonas ingrahamii]ABM03247.1 Ig domain protein, group 2 domain protein [Psychromonas ingrahamii 37]
MEYKAIEYKKILLSFVLSFILLGCGGGGDDVVSDNSDNPATINAIRFASDSATLQVGEVLQITSTATYSDYSQHSITAQGDWISSDPNVVSVSQGKLRAIRGGNAMITQRYQGQEASLNTLVTIDADVSLTLASGKLTFRWKSVFTDELGYQIQRQSLTRSVSEWEIISEVGPITEGFYGQQEVVDTTATYRIVAVFNQWDEVLSSSQGTSYFNYNQTKAMAISILPPVTHPPYSETVTFGLSQNVLSSSWFIDSNNACGSSACSNNSINLNTKRYSDGNHRLDVMAEIEPDVFVYLNQTIDIYNPNLTLTISVQDQDFNSSVILVKAGSKAAVSEVNYYIDNHLVAKQTEEIPITLNQCERWGCNDVTYPYHFVWAKEYGEHQVRVTAVDTDGQYQEQVKNILINLAPIVSFSSPLNNQLITGNLLTVTGEVENENQNVTTTVSFGDIQIGQKQATGSFSYSYSLAGLPESDYMVSIIATDEFNARGTNQVSFKYAPSLNAAILVKHLPVGYSVVEINDSQLLAKNTDFEYLITDLALLNPVDREVKFDKKPQTYMYYPHVNNKGYFASDYGPAGSLNMYLNKSGSNLNLTELVSEGSGYGFHSSYMGNILVQLPSNGSAFYLWDTDNLTYEYLKPPIGTSRWLNWRFTNNEEWLCQSAPIGLAYDVYAYQLGSGGQPVRLTDNSNDMGGSLGYGSFCAGNDSDYLAYSTSDQNDTTSSLHLYDLYNQESRLIAETTVGSGISSRAQYADGVLAWQESNSGANNLKIMSMDTGGSYSIPNATLQKVRFGKVSYTTSEGLFVWLKSSQESRKIWPSSTTHYLSQGTSYLVSGSLIYQIDD